MFRNDLLRRLEKIFGLKKTVYWKASESHEQDTLFVTVLDARPRMSSGQGGRETAVVNGLITVYSQDNRLPYGFFSKAIERAAADVVKPFFFFDIDVDLQNSPARQHNIHERQASFVFLYDAQYDPNRGELSQLTLEVDDDGEQDPS